jgi:hypothetical protein
VTPIFCRSSFRIIGGTPNTARSLNSGFHRVTRSSIGPIPFPDRDSPCFPQVDRARRVRGRRADLLRPVTNAEIEPDGRNKDQRAAFSRPKGVVSADTTFCPRGDEHGGDENLARSAGLRQRVRSRFPPVWGSLLRKVEGVTWSKSRNSRIKWDWSWNPVSRARRAHDDEGPRTSTRRRRAMRA